MSESAAIVIVSGARTAIGSYGKSFKDTPAHVLGAAAIREAVSRAGIEPTEIDEAVVGCVGQVGPDAFNARRAALEAGLPIATNAYNVNRLCGSGLQAIWSGLTEIRSGQADVVVAAGNENMTMQPFLDYGARDGYKLANRTVLDGALSLVTDPWGNYPMGVTAENVAERFKISREDQDAFALESQQKAVKAIEANLFAQEIVGVPVERGTRVMEVDEHPRADSSLERLAKLKTVFREGGTVTAGNASGINDAGAAVVLMTEEQARRRGLAPWVRVAGFAKSALDPEIMGYAPTAAIHKVLERTGISVDDLGAVELNEAFAAQALAVIRDAGLDPERVNPNGGAIALGHPIGATGVILAVKLMHHLRREQLEWGLATMCIGGGQGLALLLQQV